MEVGLYPWHHGCLYARSKPHRAPGLVLTIRPWDSQDFPLTPSPDPVSVSIYPPPATLYCCRNLLRGMCILSSLYQPSYSTLCTNGWTRKDLLGPILESSDPASGNGPSFRQETTSFTTSLKVNKTQKQTFNILQLTNSFMQWLH